MKTTIKICSLVLALCTLLCLAACGDGIPAPTGKANYDTAKSGEGTNIRLADVQAEIDSMQASDFEPSDQCSDYVLVKIKNYGEIVILLRDDIAPITVENFKKLVRDGFYTGTVFHRVMEHFMIQGGGFTVFGDELRQKPAETIKGEFYDNDVPNNLKHLRGVISMARVNGQNDSASSQFFICHETNDSTKLLNSQYATFGYVLAGMDVVDAIATCEVDNPSSSSPRPVEDVVVESITFVQPK